MMRPREIDATDPESLPGFVPWPPEFAERYRREGYWGDSTLGDLLAAAARCRGEAIAVVAGSARVSFRELDERATRLAAGFASYGLRRGDRVVVQLPNIPDFLAVSFALFRLGAMPIYALPAHRRSEIVYLAEYGGARAYVIADKHQGFDYRLLAREVQTAVPALRQVFVAGESEDFVSLDSCSQAGPLELASPRPGDVAFFLLSGGTTGFPKLIPRTHADYIYQLFATARALGVDSGSCYLAALPAAHNAALGCPGVLGTIAVGGKVVLAPDPSPDTTFPLIAAENVTLTTLMPPVVLMWLQAREYLRQDISQVLFQVGGAKLAVETARRVHSVLGCRLTHWFGMSEGLLSFTRLDDPDTVVFETTGRPLASADEIRVVDENDQDVPPGAIGQLLTRGPYTIRGYFEAAEVNRRAFTADGFLRTGDLVRLRADGNMLIEGRVKDVIVRGGEKVSAEEIEEHLMQHPAVREAALVEVPDALMGEKSFAYVTPQQQPPPTLPELRKFLRERGLADYKLPDYVEALSTLPRTAVGKIDRNELRARASGARARS
jgi:2,3-dihydroxybenzoate-AMP ligase